MSKIIFTGDQNLALSNFHAFLLDPNEKYMIIQGAAGCGKSTLIKYLIKAVESQHKMFALLLQKNQKEGKFQTFLTATTNKAVTVLSDLSGLDGTTIHSLLKLKVVNNTKTGAVQLSKKPDYSQIFNALIIIDEASMMDDKLFKILDKTVLDSKVILMGDKYQLAPVGQLSSIMETLKCKYTVSMNKIMRNSGIIMTTGAQFRQTVKSGIFGGLPNTSDVQKVDGPTFQKQIDTVFTDPNFHIDDAKILAWTNARVHKYNAHVRKIQGLPSYLTVDEKIITNNPIQHSKGTWCTDSILKISSISHQCTHKDVTGRMIGLNKNSHFAFLPNEPKEVAAKLRLLARQKDWHEYFEIKEEWLDLRPTYASTVHKSQGSTYKTVFIDLLDIGKCFIPTDVARMLYVALSRAKQKVVLYGQLPNKYGGNL